MKLAESLARQLADVLEQGNWTLEDDGTDAPVVAVGYDNGVLVYVAKPTEQDPEAVQVLRVDVSLCGG